MSLIQLQVIDVSSNKLQSIDFLNQFTNLEKIIAKNNNIQRVNLWTYKLTELDLEGNLLKIFPMFENLQKLRILNLKFNRLKLIK